jgi:hypothetical protein
MGPKACKLPTKRAATKLIQLAAAPFLCAYRTAGIAGSIASTVNTMS